MASLRLKSNLSKRLIGRGPVKEYSNKVQELKTVAEELSPEGTLFVSLIDKSEVFQPSTKLMKALMDIEYIYSLRAIQANPELADEFKEIAKNINSINKIVERRRKKTKKRFNKKEEKTEEESND